LREWGVGLLAKEQYARAADVFRRGVDIRTPSDQRHVFLFLLASALELSGRTDEALVAARKAAELADARDAAFAPRKGRPGAAEEPANREGPKFASRVAWVLYHAKRYDEAAKAYTRLIEKFASDYGSSEIREVLRDARLILSTIAVNQHDNRRAEEWLEQVLDEFPDDPAASNDLGYLWADQGKNLLRACRLTEKAVEQEPENAAYRDSLGWALYRLGRIPQALAELEKAAAKEPDPEVLGHLGDVYRKAGKTERAREAFRRAAGAYRKAGEAEKAKQMDQKAAER